MFFKTVTNSKEFSTKHGIYHQTVLKAIERMRKAIEANPTKYRGETYMQTHFIPSEHIVNNRKHFCYDMTQEACEHIFWYLHGKNAQKIKRDIVRNLYRVLELHQQEFPHDYETREEMCNAFTAN